MSKKDYQAVATALHTANIRHFYSIRYAMSGDPYYRGSCDTFVLVWETLADVLAADNPRFDRARFLEACETGTCKGMKRREVA